MIQPMLALILQISACAILVGLIWIIQIVHYPTFLFVAKEQFQNFHSFHTRAITMIVAPVMLVELVTAVMLVIQIRDSQILLLNLAGVLLIWAWTFFVSVRLHDQLASATQDNGNTRGTSQAKVIERLIRTNWLRTFLWSLRLVGLCYLLYELMMDMYGK